MILLFCLNLPAFAGGMDNWYFKFISVERKVVGETLSPEGKVIGTFTGTTSGEASVDGKQFTEKFEYFYMPEEHRVKEALVWIEDENGVFRSAAEFPLGNKFTCELTVKADSQYHLKTMYVDGRTCETTAQLKEDGVLHAVDVAKDVDGKVVFTLNYTRS